MIHLKSLVPGSLTAYVNQRDFAFTRNIYGGKKLRIMDLNAVVKKRCHVNVSKTYLKRTDPSYIIVSPNTIVENTCRRIRKYQALGYTIDLTHVRFENFQEEFKEEENDWFRLRAFANVWKDKTRYDRKTRTYHVLAIE